MGRFAVAMNPGSDILLGSLGSTYIRSCFCFEIKKMARHCEVCGKSVQTGNRIETRGKAKYLGGVGTKITGITRRQFVPNLQRVHCTLPSGASKTIRVCTQCIRTGVVRKTIKTKPFELSTEKVKSKGASVAKKAAVAAKKSAPKAAASR
jgi:large subunit ribosomal protein L28